MAVTIVDSHQRRGLGTLLFAAIALVAADAGIGAFIAIVHGENHGMSRLMRDLGGTARGRPGHGLRIPDPDQPRSFHLPRDQRREAVRSAYSLISSQGAGWFN